MSASLVLIFLVLLLSIAADISDPPVHYHDYQSLEILSTGECVQVSKAESRRNETVVIKVARPTPDYCADMLLRESQVIRKLGQSSNIVSGRMVVPGLLELEYFPAGDLTDWIIQNSEKIQTREIPRAFLDNIALEMTRAVVQAHSRGYCHLDVKPGIHPRPIPPLDNFLMRKDPLSMHDALQSGNIVLADWESATLSAMFRRDGRSFGSEAGRLWFGTRQYLAPEVVLSRLRDLPVGREDCFKLVPPRFAYFNPQDVWSLGVSFHSLYTSDLLYNVEKPFLDGVMVLGNFGSSLEDHRVPYWLKKVLELDPRYRPDIATVEKWILEDIETYRDDLLPAQGMAGFWRRCRGLSWRICEPRRHAQ